MNSFLLWEICYNLGHHLEFYAEYYQWDHTVLMLIWKAVLMQWVRWVQYLHWPNPVQDNKIHLCNAVYQIIYEAHSNPLLQDLISLFDPEVLLACPSKYIWKWIDKGLHELPQFDLFFGSNPSCPKIHSSQNLFIFDNQLKFCWPFFHKITNDRTYHDYIGEHDRMVTLPHTAGLVKATMIAQNMIGHLHWCQCH